MKATSNGQGVLHPAGNGQFLSNSGEFGLVEPALAQPAQERLHHAPQPRMERRARLQGEQAPRVRLSQPLLVLAAGGSGCRVATQAKAVFYERFGCIPENVKFLAFDSADEGITYRENRTGSMVTLAPGSEFLLFGRVPVAGIKRNLRQHALLVERVGLENLKRIHRVSIHDGAAQERSQGLLAMLWNIQMIEQALEATLRRLTERNDDLRHAHIQQSGINIVVTGSTAGGQGSGALLDLAYIVREKLHILGDLADSSRLAGMFLLPGAFVGVRGPNLQPNTFAFFRELDDLMQGRSFDARYSTGLHIQSVERPFDHVFVFDGVDERGQTWSNQDEVCDLAARTLTILFASEVGLREIAAAVNERGTLLGRSAAGFGTYLATAGQAVIRYPAQQVAERCALRQARTVVESLLQEATANEREQLSLPGDQLGLRDRLRSNRDGAPYQVRLSVPLGLEQANPEDAPTLARNLINNFQQRRLYEDSFVQMAAIAGAQQASLLSHWGDQLVGLMDGGHLSLATVWLNALIGALEQQQAAASAQVNQAARTVEQLQLSAQTASQSLDQAASSFFLMRRNQVQRALALTFDEANKLLQGRVDLRIEELVRDTLRQALGWAQQQRMLLETTFARLHQVRTWLDTQELELARRAVSHREINLVNAELIEQIFARFAGAPQADRQAILQVGGGPANWAQWSASGLAAAFSQATGETFAPVRQMAVEDVLALHWDDRSDQQWVGRLQGLTAGAWNLDRSLLPAGGAGLASFLTLGVPDEANTIFGSGNYTVTSTSDAERVVALSTIYGASFDTMRPAVRWQQEYEKALRSIGLHVLPHYLHTQDRTAQVFALGIIFGAVQNVATWFYYKPEDALTPAVRLGQGVENALGALADQPDLQKEIMVRVETRIAADGSARGLEVIDAYVNASSNDDVTRTLRRAARDYADELRRSQGAVKNQ